MHSGMFVTSLTTVVQTALASSAKSRPVTPHLHICTTHLAACAMREGKLMELSRQRRTIMTNSAIFCSSPTQTVPQQNMSTTAPDFSNLFQKKNRQIRDTLLLSQTSITLQFVRQALLPTAMEMGKHILLTPPHVIA